MKQEDKLEKDNQKNSSGKHWIAWTLFAVFIVGTIGFLMVIDAIYAPELSNPAVLPEAVGK